MMGLSKLQLHAKFDVAGLICYGNIRESVFKRQIRFFELPFGELGETYGLHLKLVEKRVVDFLFAITFLLALTADALIRQKRLC